MNTVASCTTSSMLEPSIPSNFRGVPFLRIFRAVTFPMLYTNDVMSQPVIKVCIPGRYSDISLCRCAVALMPIELLPAIGLSIVTPHSSRSLQRVYIAFLAGLIVCPWDRAISVLKPLYSGHKSVCVMLWRKDKSISWALLTEITLAARTLSDRIGWKWWVSGITFWPIVTPYI